jgi:predicted GNAT family acetyltransferase
MNRHHVRAVDETNIAAARAFLERHAETSMFMLSNLAMNGPRMSGALNSGNFKVVEEEGDVCAVFCLTRRTTITAESGGRTDLAPVILDACHAESIPIGGVVGEWNLAEAIWAILQTYSGFEEVYHAKEILQTLDLTPATATTRNPHVRSLTPQDFGHWDDLNRAFCAEEGLPMQGTRGEREALFRRNADAQLWWGYVQDGRLCAMAGLNAMYETLGQVGGVFTAPDRRRRGMSRAVMMALLADSASVHGLERVILFTGHHNHAARHLYETLGFTTIGDFALLMCAPITIGGRA